MKGSYIDELNDKQRQAVTTIEGPLLIIAGAGSGKTRVITYRILELLKQGVPQKQILALTFTNKAAREMYERVKSLSGKKLRNLNISTFHAFGVKILNEFIQLLGYSAKFSIYDQADKIFLLKEIVRETPTGNDIYDLYNLANSISAIKTGREVWTNETRPFESLYTEYHERLKIYGAVDFDDLIVLPLKLFETYPDVLATLRARYIYVMVDEFQDTSHAQYRILNMLCKSSANICVVGDDDQSIYSWRGADYRNIVQFEKDFPSRIEIKLEQNYRSTKDLLSAANSLISNNINRKGKELWTGREGKHSIELFFPADEVEEAQFIARTVQSLALRQSYTYDQFGVLVRTNGLMVAIEESLLEHNLPYHVSGGTSFFQRKEIKDFIAYLKVLANPDDDIHLMRIVNMPRRGIGKTTIQKIRKIAQDGNMSLYSAISAVLHAEDSSLKENSRANLETFVALTDRYRENFLRSRNMADLLKDLIDEIDYWAYLLLEYPDNERIVKYKFGNVTRLVEILRYWQNDPDKIDPTLYDFLHHITLVDKDDASEDPANGKINLMTIHAAKGLEFSVVFVAGVEENIIPHARSLEEDEENIEEERRLFYVAITRAKTKLFLTACRTRRVLRQKIESSPSPFLEEIPEHLLTVHQDELPVEQGEAELLFSKIKDRISSS